METAGLTQQILGKPIHLVLQTLSLMRHYNGEILMVMVLVMLL
jgi:hypothetical protein